MCNETDHAYEQALSLKKDMEKRTGYVHIILDHEQGYAVQKTTTKLKTVTVSVTNKRLQWTKK